MRLLIRTLALTCLSLFLLQTINAQTQNTWVQKNDIGINSMNGPGSMEYAVGFSIGSKGYFGTGNDANYRKDFWEYDTSTNVWTQKADFGGNKRSYAIGFSIGNKGYIGTGKDSVGYYKDFWEYNSATNTWTQKADFAGGKRASAAAFTAGGKGYVGTGFNSAVYFKDLWQYDPSTDAWTQKDSLGGPARSGAFAFSFGNNGYIGNGYSTTTFNHYDYVDLWMYDPIADTFIQKADLPAAGRTAAASFMVGGYGYICGGVGPTNRLWRYDTSTDSWTRKADIPGARAGAVGFAIGATGFIVGGGHNRYDTWAYDTTSDSWTEKAKVGGGVRGDAVAFAIGNTGYLGTGYNGGYLKDWWAFDPVANTWTQKADFGGGERMRAVGFCIGNKGYVGTGGNNNAPASSDFWCYDPAANTWTQRDSVPGGGRSSGVGFAIGNKGYLGTGYGNGLYSDFYEYDPSSDTWTAKANFAGGGRQRASAFSIDNKGYLGGGTTSNGYSDFYEYDPATDTWTQKARHFSRYSCASFSSKTKGYIGGGVGTYGNYYNELHEYDPVTNTWQACANFPFVRRDATGFFIGHHAYIAGGLRDSGYAKDVWEYTPRIIRTGNVPGPFCSAFNVPFTSDTLNVGNVFTAQLSDASGSFASPVNIGALTSRTSGSIVCNIPPGMPAGLYYRVRVVSSSPYFIGEENPLLIRITAPVPPTIAISTQTASFCVGSTVSFKATTTTGGNTSGFQWKVNGVNAGTNDSTFTYSASHGDTVTCVLTSNSPCASVVTVASNAVILSTITTATPAISISTPNTQICSGTSVLFTASTTGAANYQWTVNGTNTGTNATTYNYAPANNDTVRCIMTSLHSCATVPVVNSNAIVMTVTTTGTLSGTITSNQPTSGITITTCSSDTLLLTANVINGGTAPSFQWYVLYGISVNPIPGANSATYAPSTSVNATYTVVITGTRPCTSPAQKATAAINAIFTSPVTPAISISTISTSICSGTSTTFNVSDTNRGTSPIYQWMVNGINAGTNSNSFTYVPNNGDTVECKLTSSLHCVTSSTVNSNKVVMTVTPIVIPSVSISASSANVCAGTAITCAAVATHGGATPSYQWTVNGSNVGMDSSNYSYTPSANDTVRCVLTSNATCAIPTYDTSFGIVMVVTSKDTPTIFITASLDSSICAGTPVTFNATTQHGGITPTYQWMLNGVNVGTNTASYSNASLNQRDTISCAMISSETCITQAITNSNSVVMTVWPLPNPVITRNGSFLDAGISGGHFEWFLDSVAIPGANTSSYAPVQDGTYTVTVTDSNGCTMTSRPFVVAFVRVELMNAVETVSYYPNPAQNFVHIYSSKSVTVQVLGMDGRVLIAETGKRTVNISRLPDGVYTIMIFDMDGHKLKTGKLVKALN